jgi:excisionase family DNA binding protein
MDNIKITHIQITPEELESRIYNRLKTEFESLKKEYQPKHPSDYLTRNECRDLLKVDLSTVHNWTKRGKLKAYGIGNRVYYRRDEVEAAMKPLKP